MDIEQKEGRITSQIFSICVAPNGGALTFGDWNKALHAPKSKPNEIDCHHMNWMTQYHVRLSNIEIGKADINYNFDRMNSQSSNAFFDTGTTFLYLPSDLMDQFKKGFTDYCGKHKHHCAGHETFKECYFWDRHEHPILNDFLRTFPPMTFFFNDNIPYKWHPQDYMVQPLDSEVHYCVGAKTLTHVILGAIFMRNYDIVFDRTEKKIRFQRANCSKDPYFIDDFADHPPGKVIAPVKKPEKTISAIKQKSEFIEVKPDQTKGHRVEKGPYIVLLIIFILISVVALLWILRGLWNGRNRRKSVEAEMSVSIDETIKTTD